MSQLYRFSVICRVRDQTDISTFFKTVFNNHDDYIFQLEKGASDNFHWQCFVKLTKKVRVKRLAKILHEQPPPNPDPDRQTWSVQPCSTQGEEALKTYCMKEDTRVKGPFGKRPIYTGNDLQVMSTPFPWQQSVLDLVASTPDDRTIYWICNEAGNVGKSKLCKFLCWTKKATLVPLGTATQIKTSVIVKGTHRCYLLDLPRVRGKDERLQELFSAIEEIKNGYVMSAMYGKCQEMFMSPPHVICFSNEMPKMSLCSADRWKVARLSSRDDPLHFM